jgi:hypothetical protein
VCNRPKIDALQLNCNCFQKLEIKNEKNKLDGGWLGG